MAWLETGPKLPRPLIYDTAYAICRSGGPCRAEIDKDNYELAQDLGIPPPINYAPARPGPSQDPLCSACAKCKQVKKVMKCSGCKLIRYCGRDCQKADYARHKVVCKAVRRRFVKNHLNLNYFEDCESLQRSCSDGEPFRSVISIFLGNSCCFDVSLLVNYCWFGIYISVSHVYCLLFRKIVVNLISRNVLDRAKIGWRAEVWLTCSRGHRDSGTRGKLEYM